MAIKYIKSKYSHSEMTTIVVFTLFDKGYIDIEYTMNIFCLNDIQKLYKIISSIKMAFAEFEIGYYVINNRSLKRYELYSIDELSPIE